MRILVNIGDGINDCVSGLNRELEYCFKNGLSYSSIYFHSPVYNFLEYFNFREINYLSSLEGFEYTKIVRGADSRETLRNLGSSLHISNFMSIRGDIVSKWDEYNGVVGIHCRMMYGDEGGVKWGEFLDRELEKIKRVIGENERVSIFSDSDIIFEYLPLSSGVTFERIGCNNMESVENRLKYMGETVENIVKMGKCKRLYVTRGNFWRLSKCFVNRELEVNNL